MSACLPRGGAGSAGATRRPSRGLAGRRRCRCEQGSQALELALVLPVVMILATVVLVVGIVGVELAATNATARELARAAAAGEDAHALLASSAPPGSHLAIDPPAGAAEPGEPITARLTVPSRAVRLLGADLDLAAEATMRREP